MPPAVQAGDGSAYEACFCAFPEVTALSSTTAGVCDNVCEDQGLNQIATWFQDLCGVENSGGDDDNNGGNGGNGGNGQNNEEGTDNDRNGEGQGGTNTRPTATGQVEYVDGGDW